MHEKQGGVGRFQEWTLASRTRFALVWGAINAVIVYSLILLASPSQVSIRDVLLFTSLAVVVHGLFHYPRAKRTLAAEADESSPSKVSP